MSTTAHPRSTRDRRIGAAILYLAILGLADGCADDGSGDALAVDEWISTTRDVVEKDQPDSDVLQREPNRECELVDDVEVADQNVPLYGSATSLFGEIGTQYQCTWSGADTGSAIVRLEVVLIDEPEHFDSYAELVTTREGNTRINTELGVIHVASTVPDGQTRPITTSILLEPDQNAGVHLIVELFDADAAASWSDADHAQLLVDLAT